MRWRLAKDEIVVLKHDHIVPQHEAPPQYFHSYMAGWGLTYRDAYTRQKARLTKLETLLADMRTLDPALGERFGHPLTEADTPEFGWDFKGVHTAAELVRADADEAEVREAVKRFQGKK